jgi:alanyl aminopeptidase
VCVRFGGKTSGRACTLLTETTGAMELGAASCPDWVFGNAGGSGYYLVRYEGKLADALAAAPLTLKERLAVLADASTMAPLGRMGAGSALALLPRAAADKDPWVVRGAISLAVWLWDRAVLTDEMRPRYARFLAKTFAGPARALGFRRRPGENEAVSTLRSRLLTAAAAIGEDPGLVRQASALARRWLTDPQAIDPDQVEVVLGIAAQHGDARLFDDAVRKLGTVTDPKTRRQILGMLASFRDPALFQRALDMMIDPALDPGETDAIFSTALQEWKTLPMVTRFLDAHWGELAKRFAGDFVRSLLVPIELWCDDPHAAELERTFRARAEGIDGGARALAQALETIHLCAAAQAIQAPEAAAFLAKY